MEYQDEKIIQAMNQGKAVSKGDIYKGMRMKGDFLKFREEILLEGRMRVMLAVGFSDMSETIAKAKYSMEIESKENLSLSSTRDAVNIQTSESIELIQGA